MEIPTAREYLKACVYVAQDMDENDEPDVHDSLYEVSEAMIAFAKLHVEAVRKLQESKYYAGETGYIKKEEWEEIINNIK